MTRGQKLRVIVLWALAIWIVASCRQLADVEERTPCEGLVGSCGTCIGDSCCPEALACRQDANCSKLSACLDACTNGNEECRSSCRSSNQLGLQSSAYAALHACTASHCQKACGLQCGGYLAPSAACAGCMAASCCEQSAACSTNAECVALAYCQQPCAGSDPTCRGNCQRKHPDGRDHSRILSECGALHCNAECGYPESTLDLSCADDVPSGTGDIVLDLLVQVVSGTRPPVSAVGAEVRACTAGDELCEPPITQGVTGADGHVSLTLQAPFAGYFSVTGGGVMSFLWFPDPPLVVDTGHTESQYTPDTLAYALQLAGALDPALGHIYLRALDCKSTDLPDISFQISKIGGGAINPEAVAYYNNVAVPIEYWAGGTPPTGEGGFINLEPGAYEVRMLRRDTRECISKKELFVRANFEAFWVGVPHLCE